MSSASGFTVSGVSANSCRANKFAKTQWLGQDPWDARNPGLGKLFQNLALEAAKLRNAGMRGHAQPYPPVVVEMQHGDGEMRPTLVMLRIIQFNGHFFVAVFGAYLQGDSKLPPSILAQYFQMMGSADFSGDSFMNFIKHDLNLMSNVIYPSSRCCFLQMHSSWRMFTAQQFTKVTSAARSQSVPLRQLKDSEEHETVIPDSEEHQTVFPDPSISIRTHVREHMDMKWTTDDYRGSERRNRRRSEINKQRKKQRDPSDVTDFVLQYFGDARYITIG
jgi:hypothetical protein